MRKVTSQVPVEVVFAAAMLVLMVSLSKMFGLPFVSPAASSAAFVGIHYLLPLAGLMIWFACAAVGQRRDLPRKLLIMLPSYSVVMWAHFNIKLWTPLINPLTYDELYWATDAWLRPAVDFSIAFRIAVRPFIPFDANLYIYSFIFMFYGSFCYHAAITPDKFRELLLAALFLQGLGALAYLAFPAVGPFIFEPAANPLATQSQQFMLNVREEVISGGPAWLASNGSEYLIAGLGAMPSLHAGAGFLFVWFAYRHGRPLLPIYLAIYSYILLVAVGNRWHYIVDIPAGIALAGLAIYAAGRFSGESEPNHSSVAASLPPAPGLKPSPTTA